MRKQDQVICPTCGAGYINPKLNPGRPARPEKREGRKANVFKALPKGDQPLGCYDFYDCKQGCPPFIILANEITRKNQDWKFRERMG